MPAELWQPDVRHCHLRLLLLPVPQVLPRCLRAQPETDEKGRVIHTKWAKTYVFSFRPSAGKHVYRSSYVINVTSLIPVSDGLRGAYYKMV